MKPVIVIQARLGSTRLPKKVIAELHGTTVLNQIYRRCICADYDTIVAVPEHDEDEIRKATGLDVFTGSETDILGRIYLAAKSKEATHLIRVTADCPFVDPFMIRHLVSKAGNEPIVLNNYPPRTFPDGLDLEMCDMKFLEEALKKMKNPDREDPYTWFLNNLGEHAFHRLVLYPPMGDVNLTLDTQEDLDYTREVYELIGNDIFPTEKLMEFLEGTNKVRRVEDAAKENVEECGEKDRCDFRGKANPIVWGKFGSHQERLASSPIVPGNQASKESSGRIIIP